MKTILIPVEQADTMVSTLETALRFARKFDSYIEGFAVRVALPPLVDMDSGASVLAETFARHDLEAEKVSRSLFESFMQGHNVPRSNHLRSSLSFGWLEDAPAGDSFVGSHGRVFDLTVLGRTGMNMRGPSIGALQVALFESGHPVLIAPPSPVQEIGTNVLIAWNGSTEQARATTFAIPILQQANRVTVLTVEGGTGVPGPASEQLCQYLQSHGIPAKSLTVRLDGRNTGEAILASANSLGCDLLIKGAYTQSRLRQMFFGGATSHILAHATLPVLMAN